MKILAINPGHNGSATYLVDGEVEFYIEEERLTRQKYDANPFLGMLTAIERGVDFLVIGGTSQELPRLPWTGDDPYSALVKKHHPNAKIINLGQQHHLGHAAAAFYNSGFESAVSVVVDGSGTYHEFGTGESNSKPVGGFETESIISCDYPNKFDVLFKNYGGNDFVTVEQENMRISNSVTLVKAYEAVTNYLGFHFIEAGKTMGLAPYGKYAPELSDLFVNGRGNRNTFIPSYPAGAFIDSETTTYLKRPEGFDGWHDDHTKVTDAAKNLAWAVQENTQKQLGDLIERAVEMSGKKNVVISGGYGLNCVANYYIQKRFPELNIYVEPISHDGGTSIGLAKFVYHTETLDETIRKQSTLYYGCTVPDYSQISDLEDVELTDVSYADVAKLISDRTIVAMFQGKSEAGPRALGNRSILYDPRDVNGKDTVNIVKGREWFRPFAGSMLVEKFDEWFETAGLTETPFMMYAMEFKPSKMGEVPAITHVDGTCRIQTVSEEQNKNYYNLIKEFEKITGVPILFNTSFNLAGEPLVETLEDAIRTIRGSKIDYLYLPDIGKLVKVIRD